MPDSQTVNADWYIKVLRWLITLYILHKRPHYYNGQWKLHHNNAVPHTAQGVWEFLTLHGMEVIPHAPYSLDIALYDFFQFSTSKKNLKGHHFESLKTALEVAKPAIQRLV